MDNVIAVASMLLLMAGQGIAAVVLVLLYAYGVLGVDADEQGFYLAGFFIMLMVGQVFRAAGRPAKE